MSMGLAVLMACKPGTKPETNSGPTVPAAAPPPSVETACLGTHRKGALHWFEDDYAAALACARAKQVPLVIDMWAPWCHSCLSMKAYVLGDARLTDLDRRFVFVEIDTDREANAAVVARFPVSTWPTFFVVAPRDETIQARAIGSSTVEQFIAFVEQGERGASAATTLAPHDDKARAGDQAAARKAYPEAEAAYAAALAAAPKDWPRRSDVLVSYIASQRKQHRAVECVNTVQSRLSEVTPSASRTDFLAYSLDCADELAKDQPDLARTVRELAARELLALANDPSAPLSPDDRADALVYVRAAFDALGRKEDARASAERQAQLLDEAVATSRPMVAMTYSWPLVEVYTYLARPLALVPTLEKLSAELPKEYDPPYRLAQVLRNGGKLDDAVIWAQKADALAYGPRRSRMQNLIAELHKARGDAAGELAARRAIVTIWEALPPGQKDEAQLAEARAAVDKLLASPAR
jgi:thioredoxin-like negative regulator of GroEL